MSDLIKNEDLARTIVEQNVEINSLKSQVELYRRELVSNSETFIMLDDYTHPNVECDAPAAAIDELLNKTPQQCLADVRSAAVDEFCKSGVSPNSKAGCIGDFSVTTVQTCPECWREQDDECELCDGETDESGHSELEVVIPWTTQKDIFKVMLNFNYDYYTQQLRDNAK